MIKIENVTKKFKDKNNLTTALNDVSLAIEKNSVVIIVGKSGAGKTTLLNIIGLMSTIYDGNYYINDQNVKELNNKEISIFRNSFFGFIFQSYLLVESDTVFENIEIPLLYSKKFKNKKERIIAVAKKLEIDHLLYKKVTKLSGGERQRVAIARAIVNEPEVILMDEPTSALNEELSKVVMDEIYDYVTQNNKTLIIVTHDLDRVVRGAYRKIVLENGQIISELIVNDNNNL